VAIDNNELSFDRPITEANNTLTLQSRNYFTALEDLIKEQIVLDGIGSPEGVVEAKATRRYMDATGISGSVMYIKQVDDIAGDASMGWVLS
jgi:hypothetical protein